MGDIMQKYKVCAYLRLSKEEFSNEKEQERLYHNPKLENIKINNNSIFIKEIDEL